MAAKQYAGNLREHNNGNYSRVIKLSLRLHESAFLRGPTAMQKGAVSRSFRTAIHRVDAVDCFSILLFHRNFRSIHLQSSDGSYYW